MVEPDWQLYLRDTANLIVQQQSPRRYFYMFSASENYDITDLNEKC